nr:ATP-binding cassette domain-containing protein [Methanobrevibacter arboriphilus]
MERRINKVVSDFQIETLLNKSIFKLSGGEKQKIACASISACFPEILLLDEPSSNLDSKSTWDLRKMILSWKKMGKTVIIAEHRLYFLKDIIDRMIYMKDGEIQRIISNEEFNLMDNKSFLNLGIRALSLNNLTKNKKNIFDEINEHNIKNSSKEHNIKDSQSKHYFTLKNFKFSYGKMLAIDINSIKIPKNEIIAIIGDNGAGKSTFARCLCGLERKCKGTININGKNLKSKNRLRISYMVMQDVNHQLFAESVLDEIFLSLDYNDHINKQNLMNKEKREIAENILKKLDLLQLKDAHPMALSGGQKQRIAIGSAIASNKEIIIFDEPTSGLDLKHMKEVANNIKNLQKRGISSFIVSHDLELILECCNYVIHFEEGKIIDKYYIDDEGERKLKEFFIPSF